MKDPETFKKQLDEFIFVQSQMLEKGFGDEYMRGLANGLITAKALLTDESLQLFTNIGGKSVQVFSGEADQLIHKRV